MCGEREGHSNEVSHLKYQNDLTHLWLLCEYKLMVILSETS